MKARYTLTKRNSECGLILTDVSKFQLAGSLATLSYYRRHCLLNSSPTCQSLSSSILSESLDYSKQRRWHFFNATSHLSTETQNTSSLYFFHLRIFFVFVTTSTRI